MIKTLKENTIFENKYLKVQNNEVMFPNKNVGEYLRLLSPFDYGVFILAVNDRDEVLMINEYRYDMNCFMTIVPKGNGEKGVEPLEQAKRELKEEAGVVGDDWKEIMSVKEKVLLDGGAILFSTRVSGGGFDDSEHEDTEFILSSRFYNRKEVKNMLREGKLSDPLTIIALQHWLLEE